MALQEKLKEVKPRENSGSSSANRFDFQKNWAICKLLELSNNNNDFLLAFEFHEDILIFDSSVNPTSIEFYQIKSKNTSGKFSLTQLLTRKKLKDSTGNSILGKLLQNKTNFPKETTSLNLISNSDYGFFTNLLSQKTLVCCKDLSSADLQKLTKSLGEELSISELKEYIDSLFFHVTELTIEHHSEITRDKLERTLEKKFSTEIKYNPLLAYRTIYDEVNRKNNIEKPISTLEEVVKYKAISKLEFTEMLKIVAVEPNRFQNLQDKIFNALDSANISTSERINLIDAFKDIKIEFLKIDNPFFKECCQEINKYIRNNIEMLDQPISSSLEILIEKVKQIPIIKSQNLYSDYVLKGIILKEIYNE